MLSQSKTASLRMFTLHPCFDFIWNNFFNLIWFIQVIKSDFPCQIFIFSKVNGSYSRMIFELLALSLLSLRTSGKCNIKWVCVINGVNTSCYLSIIESKVVQLFSMNYSENSSYFYWHSFSQPIRVSSLDHPGKLIHWAAESSSFVKTRFVKLKKISPQLHRNFLHSLYQSFFVFIITIFIIF